MVINALKGDHEQWVVTNDHELKGQGKKSKMDSDQWSSKGSKISMDDDQCSEKGARTWVVINDHELEGREEIKINNGQ